MSGRDVQQSTFNHALKPLSDFREDEPSEAELLELAYKYGEENQSDVKEEFHGKYKTPFSSWHRGLNTWYPATDVDYLYYSKPADEIFLAVENKCVPEGPFNATTVVNTTPSDYQMKALSRLSELCGCPAYIRWWTLKDNADDIDEKAEKTYETFYVRELGSNEAPRKLVGLHEHMDWIDEFRPTVEGGQ